MYLASEDKLPRLSYDLIDMLVDVYVPPQYPHTMAGWRHMDTEALLEAAFKMGQASVVNALVATKNEELSDGETPDSEEEPAGLYGTPLFEQGRVVRPSDYLEWLDEQDT